MFYSLLIIAVIVAFIWGNRHLARLPQAQRKSMLNNWLLGGAALVIVILVLAGRAPWVMGVLAALLAVAGRIVQLASFLPMFKKFFGQEQHNPDQQQNTSGDQRSASVHASMNKQQAADILGVEIDATPEQVKLAHKRLMQKMHPDRGGSDALAKQINKAKDVLLS